MLIDKRATVLCHVLQCGVVVCVLQYACCGVMQYVLIMRSGTLQISIDVCVCVYVCVSCGCGYRRVTVSAYGVATISRLLKIIGLFCKT